MDKGVIFSVLYYSLPMPKNDTSWGNIAGKYDESFSADADSYQKQVILPNITRMLAPGVGDKILDLACGSGFFSGAFAEGGAKVLGVDISPELIEVAKKRVVEATKAGLNLNARFEVSSAEKYSPLPESFNKAAIILAIQNIEDVKKTLENCFKALAPQGKLFIVMNHPAFRIPKASSWGFDEKEGKQYRRIDAYLSESREKIDMTPGSTIAKKFTVSFHRSLQYYFKLFHNAGFSVKRLEEWASHRKSEAGPRGKEEDRARKEIPLFLAIELSK